MNVRLTAVLAFGAMAAGIAPLWGESAGPKSEVVINLDALPSSPAPSKPVPSPAAPAAFHASSPKAKSSMTAKDHPESKIEGLAVNRVGDRGYLGVKIAGGVFTITFYDQNKKPIPADVTGAALRWPVHYQPNDERAFLTPSADGKSLTSEKVVRPPYDFNLYITLVKNSDPGNAAVAESYVVAFHQ